LARYRSWLHASWTKLAIAFPSGEESELLRAAAVSAPFDWLIIEIVIRERLCPTLNADASNRQL